MIGKTNVGGGGGSSNRLIFGAKNETITYTGASNGSLVLNENGAGSIKLLNGSYQFSGSISGYSRNTVIDKNTSIIYVRPIGTIYWYGAWMGNPVYAYNPDPGVINEDVYFKWFFPVNDAWYGVNINDGIGYTSCTIKYRGLYGNGYAYLGYGAVNNPTTSGETTIICSSYNQTEWTTSSFTYTPTPEKIMRLYGRNYNSRGYYLEIQEWYLGER